MQVVFYLSKIHCRPHHIRDNYDGLDVGPYILLGWQATSDEKLDIPLKRVICDLCL